jgi:hypothetical protein
MTDHGIVTTDVVIAVTNDYIHHISQYLFFFVLYVVLTLFDLVLITQTAYVRFDIFFDRSVNFGKTVMS